MEVLRERRKGKPNYPNRKEVVALATTRSSRPGTDVEVASNARPEITKAPWYKRALTATATPLWVLAFVAVVAVIEYFVLLGTSMSVGKFGKLSFPTTLSTILFVFSLVYCIPAVIMLALRRTHRFAAAKLRLLLLAVPVVLTVPLPAPVYSIYAWLLRNVLASTSITIVNLFWGILGMVAIALQALFVIMLCRYVGDDGSLDVNQQELDELHSSKQADTRKLAELDRRETTRKEHLDRAKREAEAADEAVEAAAERRKNAQKAYDDMPLHKQLADLESEEQAKREEYARAKETMTTREAILRRHNLHELDREEAQAELDEAEAKRTELHPFLFKKKDEENPHYLADKIASHREAIKTSDEQRELKDAVTAHEAATTAQSKAAKVADERQSDYDEIVRQRNEEADVAKSREDRANQLTSDIEEAQKADRNLWRDFVFFPALTLAGALLFYSAWYGYVQVHLH